jgi:hypothetical protein
MDDGTGKFIPIEAEGPAPTKQQIYAAIVAAKKQHPKHGGFFHVGQIVELSGSRFRVKSVKPTELRLKLLPKE